MRLAVALAISVAVARPAAAHQTSIKYVDIIADGDRADVSIKVAPGDVTEPMRLAPDAKPTAAAAAAAPAVAPYVAAWLTISQGEQPCTQGSPTARVDEDGFVAVAWSLVCPRAIDLITLDLGRLFALDKRQEAIVQLRTADADGFTPIVVRVGDSPIALHARDPSPMRALRAGVGQDLGAGHLGFVLALLVVMVLQRDGRRWRLKPIARTLQTAAMVLGAFTFAQLLALLAAALGWVALPPVLVAGLIAASIVYTAAENLLRPDAGRLAVAIGFGLAHGLGMTADSSVVWFAIGVVLAQLTIALIALPLMLLLSTRLGAERYRRLVVPMGSAVILAIGIVWFVAGM